MSTKAVILRELQRGGDIVDKIFMKQLSWNDLFTRHTFFTNDYKYYISITASSRTKEAESAWSGLVESKLRHLVGALDRKPIIAVAHPFPKGFERIHTIANEQQMEAVKNGSTQYQAKGTKTEMTDETKDAVHQAAIQNTLENAEVPEPSESQTKPEPDGHTVYTTTYYIGLELKPLEPGNNSATAV
jgi:poly(A) polymerase